MLDSSWSVGGDVTSGHALQEGKMIKSMRIVHYEDGVIGYKFWDKK